MFPLTARSGVGSLRDQQVGPSAELQMEFEVGARGGGVLILHQETELGHLLGRKMTLMCYLVAIKDKYQQPLVELRGFELRAIAASEAACRGFSERDDFIQETGWCRGAVRKR